MQAGNKLSSSNVNTDCSLREKLHYFMWQAQQEPSHRSISPDQIVHASRYLKTGSAQVHPKLEEFPATAWSVDSNIVPQPHATPGESTRPWLVISV